LYRVSRCKLWQPGCIHTVVKHSICFILALVPRMAASRAWRWPGASFSAKIPARRLVGRAASPGYVVDHVQALKHGGHDEPGNLQWQTVEKAKNRIE
jgi:hypothetical protein